jgi:hypothetical protein
MLDDRAMLDTERVEPDHRCRAKADITGIDGDEVVIAMTRGYPATKSPLPARKDTTPPWRQ